MSTPTGEASLSVEEQITADYRKYSLPETISYNWQGRKLSIITSLSLLVAAGIIGGTAIYFTPIISSAAIASLITLGVLFGAAMTAKFIMGTPYKMEREPPSVQESHEPLSFFKVLLYKIQLNWTERKVEIVTSAIFTISILVVGLSVLQLLPAYGIVSLAAITTVTAGGGAAFTLYFLLKRPQRPTEQVKEARVFSETSQNASSDTTQALPPNTGNYPDLINNSTPNQQTTIQKPQEVPPPKVLNVAPPTPLKLDPLPSIAIQRETLFHILTKLDFIDIDFLRKGALAFDTETKLNRDLFKIFNDFDKYHSKIKDRVFNDHGYYDNKKRAINNAINKIKNSLKDPVGTYSTILASDRKSINDKYSYHDKLLLAVFTKLWVHYIQSLPGDEAFLPTIEDPLYMNDDFPFKSFTLEGYKSYLQALSISSREGIKRNIEFHTFDFSNLKNLFDEEVIALIGDFLTVVVKSGSGENLILLDFKDNPLTIEQMNYLLGKVLENKNHQSWKICYPYLFPITTCTHYQEVLAKRNIQLQAYNPPSNLEMDARQHTWAYIKAPSLIDNDDSEN